VETIDDGGEWWLPEAPDQKVSGWLTFTVDDGAQLRLVGSFRDAWDEGVRRDDGSTAITVDSLEQGGTYPRILGQIGHKAFTLEGCFRTRLSRHLFGGLPAETIHADRIYRGARYEPNEEACGDGIAVSLAHLAYWIRPAALEQVWRWPVEEENRFEEPVFEVTAKEMPPIVFERPTGTMRLLQNLALKGDGIALQSITQDVVARFDAEDVRPWRELMNAVDQLQDVVSLAMDRVACIEAVTLFHPDLVDERRKGPPDRLPIEMFARWADRAAWVEPRDLTSRDVLFHYNVIGADGLGQLLEAAARYRAELRRVIATRREGRMYNSDRLINRCAALESFDKKRRRRKGRENLDDRIRPCITLAGEPFARLVNDTDAWLHALVRRRQHVAHHLENDDEDDGFTDLVMADSTYFLFALCFLREASMPSKVFDLVEDNGRVDWLRRRLPAVLN
jgi:ApeA N-terminal domain 1